MVNHSLSGRRRAAKRRRMLKDLHVNIEKNADDFAVRELIKIRQKGLFQDAGCEGRRAN